MARVRGYSRVRIAVSIVSLLGGGVVCGTRAQARVTAAGLQPGALILPPPQTAPGLTGTASLTVQVVAGEEHTPVRGARVAIFSVIMPSAAARPQRVPTASASVLPSGVVVRDAAAAPPRIQREARTDSAGMATFTGLPADSYVVSVTPPAAFVRGEPVPPVKVPDAAEASTVVHLDHGGVIAGRISDEFGEPVTGASITVFRHQRPTGAGRLSNAGSSYPTNDLGQFRVWGLPAGDYFVAATLWEHPAGSGEAAARDGFLPTFHPGVAAFEGARSVAVKAGQERGGVEFTLARGRLGSVSGHVIDSAGNASIPAATGSASVTLQARTRTPSAFGYATSVRPDGAFTVANVPPGDYILSVVRTGPPAPTGSFTGRGPQEGAYVPVSVNGNDVIVNLQTNLGATLSGRLVVEGSVPPATPVAPRTAGRPGAGRVMAEVIAPAADAAAFFAPAPATVRPNGTFELAGVRGPVQMNAQAGRAALEAVLRSGRDISGQPIELLGTERVDDLVIVLTNEVGRIEGVVVDESGGPVADATVLVYPDNPTRWAPGSPFVMHVRTAAAREVGSAVAASVPAGAGDAQAPLPPGGFRSVALPAGRYLVVALPAGTPYLPPDSDLLASLREKATVVTVEVGRTAVLELTPVK